MRSLPIKSPSLSPAPPNLVDDVDEKAGKRVHVFDDQISSLPSADVSMCPIPSQSHPDAMSSDDESGNEDYIVDNIISSEEEEADLAPPPAVPRSRNGAARPEPGMF